MKKTIFGLVAAAVLAAVIFIPERDAQAQFNLGGAPTISINSSNAVPHNSTNTSSLIDVSRSMNGGNGLNLGFELKIAATAAGVSNVIVTLDKTLNGSTYDAAPQFSWVAAINGTNILTLTTNVVINGVTGLRLNIQNTNQGTFDFTNLSARYFVK